MKKKLRWLALGLSVTLAAASLAGCGKSEEPAPRENTQEEAEAEKPAEEAAAIGSNGEEAVAAEVMHDSITLAQNQDITSMNP